MIGDSPNNIINNKALEPVARWRGRGLAVRLAAAGAVASPLLRCAAHTDHSVALQWSCGALEWSGAALGRKYVASERSGASSERKLAATEWKSVAPERKLAATEWTLVTLEWKHAPPEWTGAAEIRSGGVRAAHGAAENGLFGVFGPLK